MNDVRCLTMHELHACSIELAAWATLRDYPVHNCPCQHYEILAILVREIVTLKEIIEFSE